MTHLHSIPLAGVVGFPIAHSLSPKLHGHWLKTYGISGYYVPLEVHPDNLASVLHGLYKAGFVGCNVTIPHKEGALAAADTATARAQKIGAANTLTFSKDGQISADNTDGFGFIENLRDGAPGWRASRGPAAVIGAGGASRAIVAALLEDGATEVRLSNRNRERAEHLAEVFGPALQVFDWQETGAMLEGAATVVNTTSLGMVGGSEPFEIPLEALSPQAVVTDCVYTPLDTPLIKGARARGCTTVDGLGMLLYQGIPGFQRWFGHLPEVTPALRNVILGQ